MTHALRLSLSIYITKEANQASKDVALNTKAAFAAVAATNTVHSGRVHHVVLVHTFARWSNCVDGELGHNKSREKPYTQYSMLLLLRIVCLTVCVSVCCSTHSLFLFIHSFIATDFS